MEVKRRYMYLDWIIRDLGSTILAVGAGAFVFKKLERFFKLLLFQAAFYLLLDAVALHVNPNLWLYNLYVPVETVLLFLAAGALIDTHKGKFVIYVLISTFSVIYGLELVQVGVTKGFVIYSLLTEYVMIACVFSYLFYHLLHSDVKTALNWPAILVSLSLIIYSAGCIPCISAMQGLMRVNSQLSQEMFQNIVVVLGTLRYVFLLLAFLLVLYGDRQNRS